MDALTIRLQDYLQYALDAIGAPRPVHPSGGFFFRLGGSSTGEKPILW
jgi:hypothetical protein